MPPIRASHARRAMTAPVPRLRQLIAILAVLVSTVGVVAAPAGAEIPRLDWTDRPTSAVVLPDGWTVQACEGDAPLLCTTEQNTAQGVVEHLALPLESQPQLQAALDAGTEVRTALAAEIDRFHATFREDREQTCPQGWSYNPDTTRGAVVGGLPGITYGFTVTDVDGALVERVVGFMTVRETAAAGIVDLVVGTELNAGACLADEGTAFATGGLGRFTPSLTQLVARSTFGPGSQPAPARVLDGRVATDDAVGTAIALSALAFDRADVALLARDDLYADTLAAGGAQGALQAPLLLTGPDELDQRIIPELERLGADQVIVLGGSAAVHPAVTDQLAAQGYSVQRLAGDDRIATALAIAQALPGDARRAVLVRADASAGDPSQATADSLAAGALAAVEGAPVLLTPGDRLDQRVADHLLAAGVEEVVVAGGAAAVATSVTTELVGLGIAVDRVAGGDRAETAVGLAARRGIPDAAYADTVVLVDGRDWVDGLVSASLGVRALAPLVLADGPVLPVATQAFLAAADPASRPTLLCTPSVDPVACEQAVTTLNGGVPVQPS